PGLRGVSLAARRRRLAEGETFRRCGAGLQATGPPLTLGPSRATMYTNVSSCFEIGKGMRAQFLGTDPDSQEGQSPTQCATDRTDRRTYIAQGWVVTDPQVLADVGPVPDGEAIIAGSPASGW